MSFFGLGKITGRYGVIIDIGSGSVLTAIVHSDPDQKHPQIIWSHREHGSLRNIDSMEQSAKSVITALINASMQLDSVGRKALYDYNKSAKLAEIQCSISAPWSYTVTKTINYTQEKPFNISKGLIDELIGTIQEKIDVDLKKNEALNNLGLQIITHSTMDILANGYHVTNVEGNQATQLTISYSNVVAQQYLIEAIDEIRDKLFAEANLNKLSFIQMLYCVTRELLVQVYDVCLVDITYEATEIGIVRDGVLTYSTHTPFGSFSIAREIAAITGVPLHEAFGYLHCETPYAFIKSLNKEKQENIKRLFESYIDRISSLFHETGDSLSIPKRISLHADLKSEPLFIDLISKAAKQSAKTEPLVTQISDEIIRKTFTDTTKETKQTIPADTALLLSAQFFHKQPEHQTFEYL